MNKKLFAERLTRLRKETGLLGKEFAAKIKVKYGTYSTWEGGHRVPGTEKFLRLAKVLGVNAHYLAGESNVKTPPTNESEGGALVARFNGRKGEDFSNLDELVKEFEEKARKWREERDR